MIPVIGQKFTVTERSSLLPFLLSVFPNQSRTSVKAMLSRGRINVDGETVTAFDHPLVEGSVVTILPKAIPMAIGMKEEADDALKKAGVEVIFEDEHIIIVDKPSGMLTVSAPGKKAKGDTLYSLLNSYVKTSARAQRKIDRLKGQRPDHSLVKIWIIHRLDRETSGLLVFAKDDKADAAKEAGADYVGGMELVEKIRWKDLVEERMYTAFLEGELPKEKGSIQSYLSENPKSLKMRSSEIETPDSKLAISHFRVVGTVTARGRVQWSKVEFRLQTGRKNQIRVHFSEAGHPVVGDVRYGAVTDPAGRLALHASTLIFKHPYTGKIMSFRSELPPEFNRLEQKTHGYGTDQNQHTGIR